MNKLRKIITVVSFVAIISILGLAEILLPDGEISYSERRPLAQFPEITASSVFSAKYSETLEEYLLDQFPLRDSFRTLNAALRLGLFAQKDVDGIYLADGSLSKFEKTLNSSHVAYCADFFEKLAAKYFSGANLFVAIPPDKNAVLAEPNGYPSIDYDELERIMVENSPSMTYIDLFGLLGVDDYYSTDSHWRQEDLQPVLDALSAALGTEFDPVSEYTEHEMYPFNGVYAGQSALPVEPDTLVYLTNEVTDAATVYDAESSSQMPVYTTDKFGGTDGYDLFLGGSKAFLTIDNPLAENDRELVIFRDSFGSSLAPLLISGYQRVTVIDLRYINSAAIPQFMDTSEQANANRDVLFMLSSSLLNGTVVFR